MTEEGRTGGVSCESELHLWQPKGIVISSPRAPSLNVERSRKKGKATVVVVGMSSALTSSPRLACKRAKSRPMPFEAPQTITRCPID
jgi:hypothetical protein